MARRYFTALYSFLGLLITAVTAFGQTVAIPFELDHGLIMVHVKVNGDTSTMVIDTGSKISFLNDHMANESLKPNTSVFSFKVKMDNVSIDVSKQYHGSLLVARVSMTAFSKSVGHQVDGILGEDFLSTFNSVRIDYKQHTLTLE